MRLFLDTSAYMKRYLREPGTPRVVEACAEAEEVILSAVVLPESMATLNRLRREGKLSDDQYATMKTEILGDLDQATLIELERPVLDRAIACLERAALRALDALHVASALEVKPDRFLSADRRQSAAARAMGLNVEEISG